MNSLIKRIESKDSIISIIGLGYVGLPLAISYLKQGYSVIGLDKDKEKIRKLRNGEKYIEHIDIDLLEGFIANNKFQCFSEISEVSVADAIILCLPTPLGPNNEPDLSYVVDSVTQVSQKLSGNQVISLESTTYPGTTEEVIKPILEANGWIIGKDLYLVYSPEREDPGNPEYENDTIPKLCSGSTRNCLEVGMSLYQNIISEIMPVSSTQIAEMAKILENTYRSVNIALVNELKVVADKMEIDIYEVIEAAASKPFGFKAFYPGPGVGGHCIPIDPFYLTWKAKQYNVETRFIELAAKVNNSMIEFTVTKVASALNSFNKKIKGSNVLVLGLAYKKNVDDMRESPSLALISELKMKGANVQYSDPHIKSIPKLRDHSYDLESIEVNQETLGFFDCVIIATDHDLFDWDMIEKYSNIILDTRGVFKITSDKIIRA